MNKITWFILFIFCYLQNNLALSQDVIILKNNVPVSCKIIEVTTDSIKFAHINYTLGNIEMIKRDLVTTIHFNETKPGQNIRSKGDTSKINPSKNQPIVSTAKSDSGITNALYSMLFPGLGDYKVRQKRYPYWITGLVSYGCIGSGIFFKIKSNSQYHDYKSMSDVAKSTYLSSNNNNHKFILLTGLGAALWIGDVVLTGLKGYKNTRKPKEITTVSHLMNPILFIGNCNNIGFRWQF